MLIETVLISTGVAILGVLLGSKVQRTCRFIYPIDAVTILVTVFILADAAFRFTPVDPFWYLPFAAGYVVGYLVVGRTSYIMVWSTSLSGKFVDMRPWVVWTENGNTYLQEQSNIALFRRIVFGIRHEVVSNSPLESDWIVDTKYPLFPQFSKPTVIAENIATTYTYAHLFWRFRTKRYTTHITVAYAGMVSKMQLAQDEHALVEMQQQNTELIGMVHELTSQQGPMLMEMALRLEQDVNSKTPANRMYDLIRMKRKGGEKDGVKKDRTEQAE